MEYWKGGRMEELPCFHVLPAGLARIGVVEAGIMEYWKGGKMEEIFILPFSNILYAYRIKQLGGNSSSCFLLIAILRGEAIAILVGSSLYTRRIFGRITRLTAAMV